MSDQLDKNLNRKSSMKYEKQPYNKAEHRSKAGLGSPSFKYEHERKL